MLDEDPTLAVSISWDLHIRHQPSGPVAKIHGVMVKPVMFDGEIRVFRRLFLEPIL